MGRERHYDRHYLESQQHGQHFLRDRYDVNASLRKYVDLHLRRRVLHYYQEA